MDKIITDMFYLRSDKNINDQVILKYNKNKWYETTATGFNILKTHNNKY